MFIGSHSQKRRACRTTPEFQVRTARAKWQTSCDDVWQTVGPLTDKTTSMLVSRCRVDQCARHEKERQKRPSSSLASSCSSSLFPSQDATRKRQLPFPHNRVSRSSCLEEMRSKPMAISASTSPQAYPGLWWLWF